jgi:hypothetical protein
VIGRGITLGGSFPLMLTDTPIGRFFGRVRGVSAMQLARIGQWIEREPVSPAHPKLKIFFVRNPG